MREVLPQRRYCESFDLAFPAYTSKLYTVTLGCHPDGRLAEVFISSHRKVGSDSDLAARDTAILISMGLQHGATLEGLTDAITHDAAGRPEGLAGQVLMHLLDWQRANPVTGEKRQHPSSGEGC